MNRVKATTLIELILALSLVGVILLAAGSFDLVARKFFRSSDIKSQLLGEAGTILEYIAKDVMETRGDPNNIGVFINAGQLLLKQKPPDIPVTYALDTATHILTACTPAECITLSRRVVTFDLNNNPLPVYDKGFVRFGVTVRANPAAPVDFKTNPEVTLYSSAALLQHSAN